MKKLISIMLALVFVFSMATVAFANESESVAGTTPEAISFAKNYVDAENSTTTAATYPAEKLTFNIVADNNNPDTSLVPYITANAGENKNTVTVEATTQTVEINFPQYTEVGTYLYTLTENSGVTQGVDYSTASYTIKVIVYWQDVEQEDGSTTRELTSSVTVWKGNTKVSDGEGEDFKFDNVYDLGSLSVKKVVSGNLADQNKEFNVTVAFSSEMAVLSGITYTEGDESKTVSMGTEGKSGSVTLTLKHDETVTFNNIPVGVSYTVVEADYTTGDKNSEDGYDPAQYSLNNDTATTTSVEDSISTGDADSVVITNNKGTDIDTGISLDSVPFILILAVCAGAAILFVTKRRSVEF